MYFPYFIRIVSKVISGKTKITIELSQLLHPKKCFYIPSK